MTPQEKIYGKETSVVNSFNEWDPLEEVIIGRLDNATMPSMDVAVKSVCPPELALYIKLLGARKYPQFLLKKAQKELDNFRLTLEREGVKVREPGLLNFSKKYSTPAWSSRGFCTACPRDVFVVIGDEIIESPMPWRSRYFEMHAYRDLLNEYFRGGARWTSAPKPVLDDGLYDQNYSVPKDHEEMRWVLKEVEPVFDAADFVRCGTDIFVTRSNVTNLLGIEWMRRHLGSRFTVHEIETLDTQPMHIDATFMPLAPGKLLVNPERIRVENIPKIFNDWEVLVAPQPDIIKGGLFNMNASMCSKWISMNVFMLDEKRVVIEEKQKTMISFLKKHGFDPIPLPFMNYAPFGGSFHCATLDIRRTGRLQSYF